MVCEKNIFIGFFCVIYINFCERDIVNCNIMYLLFIIVGEIFILYNLVNDNVNIIMYFVILYVRNLFEIFICIF